jgi:hypothetical protein
LYDAQLCPEGHAERNKKNGNSNTAEHCKHLEHVTKFYNQDSTGNMDTMEC